MKLYFRYILICFSIFLSNPSLSSNYEFWNNEEEMKPYFRVSQYIWKLINIYETLYGNPEDRPKEEFKAHSWIFRTPKYLYLETYTGENYEILRSIYSPLGVITIYPTSADNIMKMASAHFFKFIQNKWEIEEVTERLEFYKFINNKEDGIEILEPLPTPEHLQLEKNDPHKSHIYLVKSYINHKFIKDEDINAQRLIIYTIAYLSEKQSRDDKALFSKFKSIKELNKF
jgi:hypothetical protein